MKIMMWNELNDTERSKIMVRGNLSVENKVRESVYDIIVNVKQFGDRAVKAYTQQFDGVLLENLGLDEAEWENADKIDDSAKQAINSAYKNIKRFHALQIPRAIVQNLDDISLSKEYRAIEKVGLYIPGGTAPLVSTLLMLGIPAQLAGCKKIVLVTPPSQEGSINPAILYAAKCCGINQVYKMGGAQAIAALAYGTETVPKVMKIFGPGNKYVTEAKLQVFQDPLGCALDMPAGPSEVLVIADNQANPSFVAADLLAQAEHDVDAKVILLTTDINFANKVNVEIEAQTKSLSRQAILGKSLKAGYIIVANSIEDAFSISNIYAPEHLILQIENPRSYLSKIQNAGSVFVGPWSAEALGDYASGPNAVLPTYGYANSYSGITVESYMKSISFQEVAKEGLINIAKCVEVLADLEGLDAHKNSMLIRRQYIEALS